VRALPGVTAAGATAVLPLQGRSWTGDLFIEGRPDVHGRELRHQSITAGYLEALGVRLISGRTLQSSDRADAPLVIVVNATLARNYFSHDGPIGRRIAFERFGEDALATIVGVVSDEAQDGLGAPIGPEVYDSHLQEEWSDMAILVRSTPAAAIRFGRAARRARHRPAPGAV